MALAVTRIRFWMPRTKSDRWNSEVAYSSKNGSHAMEAAELMKITSLNLVIWTLSIRVILETWIFKWRTTGSSEEKRYGKS